MLFHCQHTPPDRRRRVGGLSAVVPPRGGDQAENEGRAATPTPASISHAHARVHLTLGQLLPASSETATQKASSAGSRRRWSSVFPGNVLGEVVSRAHLQVWGSWAAPESTAAKGAAVAGAAVAAVVYGVFHGGVESTAWREFSSYASTADKSRAGWG